MKPLVIIIISGLNCFANPIVLKDLQGRSITATVNGMEGEEILITREGKPFRIPLASLDEPSRELAKTTQAISAAVETRIRLRAQTVSSGRDTQKYWETSWGSYDKDITRTRMILTKVECTLGGGPAEIVVQWIGSVAGSASKQAVHKLEKIPIILKANGTLEQAFAAQFEESDTNYEALGVRQRSGVRYVGWVARVITADGTVLGIQASAQPLLTAYPLDPPK